MPVDKSSILFGFFSSRYNRLFWIFFSGTVILYYTQLLQTKPLHNKTATTGMASLETASTISRATSIINSWQSDSTGINNNTKNISLLQRAKTSIAWSFPFIVFYSCLLIILISWLQERAKPSKKKPPLKFLINLSAFTNRKKIVITNMFIFLAIIAGGLHILEKSGMLLTVAAVDSGKTISFNIPLCTAIAAYIKCVILFLLGLYISYMLIFKNRGLQSLSSYLQVRLEQLIRYRVIFAGITGFGLSIWALDQGQDLLVNSNAEDTGVIFFLTLVTITAFSNWYLAKFFYNKPARESAFTLQAPTIQNSKQFRAEKKVPRLLGIATFILPATGILNSLHGTYITYAMDFFPAYAMLIVVLAIFFVLLKNETGERLFITLKMKKGFLFAKTISIVVMSLFAFIFPALIWILKHDELRQPTALIWLYWNLVSLAIAFYFFTSVRTLVFSKPGLFENNVGMLVLAAIIMASLFFLWINGTPLVFAHWNNHFMTLPLLLCGIIFYTFAFSCLIRLGQKIKINLVLFILVIGLAISITSVNSYHNVSTRVAVKNKKVLPLGDYFKQWILHRQHEFSDSTRYTVFIVNSYGGGIRAAAYTGMVLNWLDSAFLQNRKKAFEHFAFSISGASGGTIGAAIQCAYRQRYLDSSVAPYNLQTPFGFYQHDFLSPVLIPDIGRDVFASAAGGAPWGDRSAIQEQTWEAVTARYLDLDIAKDYDSLWISNKPYSYEVPLLFSNTLNVDDGLKGIFAPVLLNHRDFPATLFVRDRLDSVNAHIGNKGETQKDSVSLSLMSGAFLSARFPFITPSGKMAAGFHFMDGGGKDNSGASTSELIYKALLRYIDTSSDNQFKQLASKVDFCFVSINNSPQNKIDPRQLVENRFELISPLVGIINSGINGNARAADSALASYKMDRTTKAQTNPTDYYTLYPNANFIGNDTNYKAILPLGWQISKQALGRLKASFDSVNLHKPGSSALSILLQKVK